MLDKLPRFIALVILLLPFQYMILIIIGDSFWSETRYNTHAIIEIESTKELSMADYEYIVGGDHFYDKHRYEVKCKYIRPQLTNFPNKIYTCTTREKGLNFQKGDKLLVKLVPAYPATFWDRFLIIYGKSSYTFRIEKWDAEELSENYITEFLQNDKNYKISFFIVYPILIAILFAPIVFFGFLFCSKK